MIVAPAFAVAFKLTVPVPQREPGVVVKILLVNVIWTGVDVADDGPVAQVTIHW